MPRLSPRWVLVAAALVGAGAPATVADLGGPDRFLTHISTDKPIYRPGETAYVRAAVLDAKRRTPLRGRSPAMVEIFGPKGDRIASGPTVVEDGVLAFSWPVPGHLPGGPYRVRVHHPATGHAPAERSFELRAFRAPRLSTEITFLRKGYGPGDRVQATLEAERVEGGSPAGAAVEATARVDGQEVARIAGKLDENGRFTVAFDLPATVSRGEGAIAFAIEDGGVVETAAKTLPILVNAVDLHLYPEGGELVAGLPGRVYFEARAPSGKPADVAGIVRDSQGAEVARFSSEHEGRGRFAFTPRSRETYTVELIEPAGIGRSWSLPPVQEVGASIMALADRFEAGTAIRVQVAATEPVVLTLAHREQVLTEVTTRGGSVRLDPQDADGVLRVTASTRDGRPLAERLVFVQPRRALEVRVETDRTTYGPGDRVRLTASTRIGGRPVAAVLGLTVTDRAVLELIERRERAPALPVMALLEPEVKDLADAEIYLDRKNPKSGLAVDLLLGTQGWRRFAFSRLESFLAEHGDDARRTVALRTRPRPQRRFEDHDAELAIGGNLAVAEGAPLARDRPARPAPLRAPPPPAPVAEAEEPPPFFEEAQADRMAKRRRAPSRPPPSSFAAVRVYAHRAEPGPVRDDFTETVLFAAQLRTDAKTGQATVEFDLSDSVTTFRARADGFTADGVLGAGSGAVVSVQPFSIEPKLPLEVTAGDLVTLPVALVNAGAEPLSDVAVSVEAPGGVSAPAPRTTTVKAGARDRVLLDLPIESGDGGPLTVRARFGQGEEVVTRPLSVVPRGFPASIRFGGLVGPGAAVRHGLEVPATVVPGSVRARIAVHATPLGSLTEALARLIREPHGCFEQTSSTTYPLTMAQQYFTTHSGVDPALVRAAQEKLDRGYQRLTSFECKSHGYEWFGEDPGHEALTAYGLLHFTDLGRVHAVDQAMVDRTRTWLVARRDGQGGFTRARRALHTWVEDRDASNAYILWALIESGQASGLDPEVAAVLATAQKSDDRYVTALGALVALGAGKKAAAEPLLAALAKAQDQDGRVTGGKSSIVGSGGEALAIETTALSTLGFLRGGGHDESADRAIRYLARVSDGGRYGSTQSTVLALRAIVAYDEARAKTAAPGSVRVLVDGKSVGGPVRFAADERGVIELPDISSALSPGRHTVGLEMEGGGRLPYTVLVEHFDERPSSSDETAVALSVSLAKPTVREGELIEANATLVNLRDEALPTAIALVGLPGGLEARHDQLKELVKKGTIDAYEVLGRNVALYWRGLAPKAQIEVPLSLVAAIPGTYTGPASRAYLYYTDEHKRWTAPLRVEIQPRTSATWRQ